MSGDPRPCYLCSESVDGNSHACDPTAYKICLWCAAKLRRLGMDGGLRFILGPVETSIQSVPTVDPDEAN